MRRTAFTLPFLLVVLGLLSAGGARLALHGAALGRAAAHHPSPSVRVEVRRSDPARLLAPIPAVEVAVRPRAAWSEFEAPEGIAHHGQIVVDVVDASGRPVDEADVQPVDCPGFTIGPGGEYEVETGPCALRAVRHDGRVLAKGPVSTAVVEDSDPAYVSLQLPEERYGGIGIDVEPDADGMRVVDVWPGTPAEEVGLEPGDRILAVEGRSVAGMGTDWFVEEVTGAEGTSVELTLADQDSGASERTLHVPRAFLQG